MCTEPIMIKGALFPCGQCHECRVKLATMWACRCVLESLDHPENVFLTLTYNDDFLPENRSLSKKELQTFMKRFRKSIYPAKCRFFASGEYGKKSGKRPHYHLLIFGIGINNPVFRNLSWDYVHQGFWCDCVAWNKGNCFIGTVTIKSAYYVAKYSVKKLTGKVGAKYYKERGVIPEFSLQSRRPGIGLSYLDHHQDEIAHKGYVSINGTKFCIPRYFQDKLKERIPFYRLVLSDESFTRATEQMLDWLEIEDDLEHPHQYIAEQKKQRARNLEKSIEMKGEL